MSTYTQYLLYFMACLNLLSMGISLGKLGQEKDSYSMGDVVGTFVTFILFGLAIYLG